MSYILSHRYIWFGMEGCSPLYDLRVQAASLTSQRSRWRFFHFWLSRQCVDWQNRASETECDHTGAAQVGPCKRFYSVLLRAFWWHPASPVIETWHQTQKPHRPKRKWFSIESWNRFISFAIMVVSVSSCQENGKSQYYVWNILFSTLAWKNPSLLK